MKQDKQLLEVIVGNLLINKGYILSVAESCTGGNIIDRITDVPGTSKYLDRGFITYSNRAKIEELGVPQELIEKHGSVSKEVAVSMAEGARKVSGANVALSVTGIIGPSGGTEDKPVGTVHVAVAGSIGTRHQYHLLQGGRLALKERAATEALTMLRNYLQEEG